MYPFDKENILRKLSVKILVPILRKINITANEITLYSFLIFGLSSIFCFSLGNDYLGLFLAIIMAALDYCDGTIARERNECSHLGEYLDTSLDWLYLMLIIGALSYNHDSMIIGYIILITLTFSNWVQYNGKTYFKLPFYLGIIPILVISILFKQVKIGLMLIMVSQSFKTIIMYWRSLNGTSAEVSHNSPS